AVWYSRDSVSSRVRACSASNRRVFSMALTAWSAKVFRSSISLSENGPGSARHHDDADGSALPQHWDEEAAPIADHPRQACILRVELEIGYVDNRALEDCSARPSPPGGWPRVCATYLLGGLGVVVVLGDLMYQLAVELKECAEEAAAQFHRPFDDSIEDGLHI